MGDSTLVKIFGFPATLVHGDTTVLDRWKWVSKHLPSVKPGSKKLLDVGCGTGAFTIGAALRGYESLGLSWDERNQTVARERAKLCAAARASFEILDVRQLDQRSDLRNQFHVILCCENIEHILDDTKLLVDMSQCLTKDGILLLTTPNLAYRPMTNDDDGPFLPIEDGGHVRRGYTPEMLETLCAGCRLKPLGISYCSGFLSQKVTGLMRIASRIHPLFSWAAILPLRPLIPPFDPWITKVVGWPGYSITLVASKL